jgi:hypothetical protein
MGFVMRHLSPNNACRGHPKGLTLPVAAKFKCPYPDRLAHLGSYGTPSACPSRRPGGSRGRRDTRVNSRSRTTCSRSPRSRSSMKIIKGARCAPILEPAVLAGVDLDQFAVGFTPQARLMKASSLLARQPKPILDHPPAQRLSRDLDSVFLEQNLRRQARAEIGIARPNQLDHILEDARNKSVVRSAATSLVDERTATTIAIRCQQPARLPRAQPQNRTAEISVRRIARTSERLFGWMHTFRSLVIRWE